MKKKPLIDNVFTFFQPPSPALAVCPSLSPISLHHSVNISLPLLAAALSRPFLSPSIPFHSLTLHSIYFLPKPRAISYHHQHQHRTTTHVPVVPIVLWTHSITVVKRKYKKKKFETIATNQPGPHHQPTIGRLSDALRFL